MNRELKKLLEQKGVYFTHLVKELTTLLYKVKKPLTQKEITQKLNREDFFPNPTSIYRQIKRLSALNFIEESLFSDNKKRYCWKKTNHHHHFECQDCGMIADIPVKSCNKIVTEISNQLKGFSVKSHHFNFKGTCKKCTN